MSNENTIGKVVGRDVVNEMEESFLSYAMSVITDRAIPNIKDGMKPVHRRIIWSMWEQGVTHDVPFRKAARVVGDVLGRYHCHGDSSVFDAIVRLVQPFSMRYPLIEGQGNFGSIDGDPSAAMRYVECRLSKIAKELIVDIDKNTIPFTPNYDETLKEPVVLPAKLPNILLNGATGIAVSMATNIPSHNICEVIDAIISVMENKDIPIRNLVIAPDFPTGGIIIGRHGYLQAYETGRGPVTLRGKAEIEDQKRHQQIVITELPYQVNKATLTEKIADLSKEDTILGISDIRDESDKEGIRLVIEIKNGFDPNVILNQLYKFTDLQINFGINMVALIDGVPKTVSLKDIINEYIKHRENVVVRRTQFDLDVSEKRLHILKGLLVALDNIDEVVKIIRGSESATVAKPLLMQRFGLSEEQTKSILDMKLSRLTGLERGKILSEANDLEVLIRSLRAILEDHQKVLDIIRSELLELRNTYGDDRRTKIQNAEFGDEKIDIEELIQDEEVIVTVSKSGYIKRTSPEAYRLQRRGGKGSIGIDLKDEDCIVDVFATNTKDYLLMFTDAGKVHWTKVYEVPAVAKNAKGKLVNNLLALNDEKVVSILPVKSFENQFVMFALKSGNVVRLDLSNFANPRRGGIKAINLEEDELICAVLTNGSDDILLATKYGKAIRFAESEIRITNRGASGVRGIRLGLGDQIISMDIVKKDSTLLVVTSTGYGKRSEWKEYVPQARGGGGVKSILLANNLVCGVMAVTEEDEILVTTKGGIVIRLPVSQVRVQGRATRGVRLMDITRGDEVGAIARLL